MVGWVVQEPGVSVGNEAKGLATGATPVTAAGVVLPPLLSTTPPTELIADALTVAPPVMVIASAFVEFVETEHPLIAMVAPLFA